MNGPHDRADAQAQNWTNEVERAKKAFDANKRLVESGEKFRARKPSPPRRRSHGGGGNVRKVG